MGLDLQAMLDASKKSTGGATYLKFAQPPGAIGSTSRYTFRILPPTGDQGVAHFKATLQYFDTPNGMKVGSPTGKDPAAEIYWALKDNPAVTADKSLAKALGKLKPNTKYFYNVVDRADNTVKVMSVPITAHNFINDELVRYLGAGEDLTEPKTGKDFILTIARGPGSFFNYSSVSLDIKPSEIGVEDWDMHTTNLEQDIVTTRFTEQEITAMLPDILGEFYDTVMDLYN